MLRFFGVCIMYACSITALHAQSLCDRPETLEKVRIYFVNGMDNSIHDMNAAKDVLKQAIGNNSSNVYRKSVNFKEHKAKEVYEVVRQRLNAVDPQEFWEWWNNPSSNTTPDGFKSALANQIHSASDSEYFNDSDLRVMINDYLRDLRAGKKVVLVSHSQGNFYANNAYSYIKSLYPKLAKSMGIVAVATPASICCW